MQRLNYALGDKYEQMEYDLKIRDLKLEEKQKELDQVLKERDDFKVKLEKWTNASVLQNEVLNQQRYLSDKSCIGFGVESSSGMESDNSSGDETLTDHLYENFKREKAYKAVPPPTGTIIPPRANVSFTGIDELAIRNKVNNQEKIKSSQPEIDRNKVIIEDWVDSDDEETVLNLRQLKKKNMYARPRVPQSRLLSRSMVDLIIQGWIIEDLESQVIHHHQGLLPQGSPYRNTKDPRKKCENRSGLRKGRAIRRGDLKEYAIIDSGFSGSMTGDKKTNSQISRITTGTNVWIKTVLRDVEGVWLTTTTHYQTYSASSVTTLLDDWRIEIDRKTNVDLGPRWTWSFNWSEEADNAHFALALMATSSTDSSNSKDLGLRLVGYGTVTIIWDETLKIICMKISKEKVIQAFTSTTGHIEVKTVVGQGSREKGSWEQRGYIMFVLLQSNHQSRIVISMKKFQNKPKTHKPKRMQGSGTQTGLENNVIGLNHSISQETLDKKRSQQFTFKKAANVFYNGTADGPRVPQAVLSPSSERSTVDHKQYFHEEVNIEEKEASNGNPEEDLKDYAIIDSGCSGSMTGDKDKLSDFKDYKG
ncbi:hypothetical protein Tco_0672796 [Tanacetum coccineum]